VFGHYLIKISLSHSSLIGWPEHPWVFTGDVHEFLHAFLGPNSHIQWFYILAWQLIKYFLQSGQKVYSNASYDVFTYTDG